MKTSRSSSYNSRSGLEKALEDNPAIFEVTDIAKNWKPLPSRAYRPDYSNLQKDREDVLIESVTLSTGYIWRGRPYGSYACDNILF